MIPHAVVVALFALLIFGLSGFAASRGTLPPAAPWYDGYPSVEFLLGDRSCILIQPHTPAPGKPWIWRTEFLGHEPQGDLALLARGFHVGYINVQNLFGAPAATGPMLDFYKHVTTTFGLNPKVVLEGFSRGGLYAFNYAALHPEHVAGLYVDNPVCDLKSWPGGRGKSKGAPDQWASMLVVYQITQEQALHDPINPVDHLDPLLAGNIPILAVCGDADEAVPFDENAQLVQRAYEQRRAPFTLILKPGGRHHPHSLKDPTPIVDFVVRVTGSASHIAT